MAKKHNNDLSLGLASKGLTELHNLNGRCAVVTGGAQGFGAAIALRLAEAGAKVVIADRNEEGASQKAEEINSLGYNVSSEKVDIFDASLVNDLVQRVVSKNGRIDILVNNAGAIPSGSLDVVDDAAWRAGWELKVFGYVNMCRSFYKHMANRGHGVIINNIGNSGENPDIDYIAGSSGNASLMAFSLALGGRSMDHGVRVVAVNPGPIDTGRMEKMLKQRAKTMLGDEGRWKELLARFPGGRGGTAEEVGDLIVFLASERAGFISGCVMTIDGGITARRSVV